MLQKKRLKRNHKGPFARIAPVAIVPRIRLKSSKNPIKVAYTTFMTYLSACYLRLLIILHNFRTTILTRFVLLVLVIYFPAAA